MEKMTTRSMERKKKCRKGRIRYRSGIKEEN